MSDRPDITPDLKVGDLLAHWPDLEDVLIAAAPPFANLRNPLLRRTVAKVTTLHQAARVGGLPVAQLIARLRDAAGLPALSVDDDGDPSGAPAWAAGLTIVERYDARADIEAGQHPVGRVLGRVQSLAADEAFELVTGFEPAPLIDKARGLGGDAFTRLEGDGVFVTTFRGTARS